MPFIPSVEFFIIKSIGINIAKLSTNSFIYSIKSLLVLRISKFDILNYYRVLSCYYLLYWHEHITLFNLEQGIMKMCFWAFVPLYILFVRVYVFHHVFWLYNKCVIMYRWWFFYVVRRKIGKQYNQSLVRNFEITHLWSC